MGLTRFANAVVLLQLAVVLLTTCFLAYGISIPPAEAPHPHHHHHHPKHFKRPPPPPPPPHYTHPPPPPPTPPTHPPPPPPPPVKPPTYPPPPVKAPPPATPPVKPPTYPPPPVKAPPPATPPVKPPTYPPPPPRTPPPPPKKVVIQGVVFCKACKSKRNFTLVGATPLSGAKVKLQCGFPRYRLVEFATTNKYGIFVFTSSILSAYPTSIPRYCRVYLVSAPPKAKCKVPTNFRGGIEGAVPARFQYAPKGYLVYRVGPFAFEAKKKCY